MDFTPCLHKELKKAQQASADLVVAVARKDIGCAYTNKSITAKVSNCTSVRTNPNQINPSPPKQHTVTLIYDLGDNNQVATALCTCLWPQDMLLPCKHVHKVCQVVGWDVTL